jgi:carbon-monoxide dehydrogenase large subunit
VYTGATAQGQAHKTTLAQIAAEQLGVDYNDVTVVTADTAAISLGMGTFAARTAVNAGSSVHLAAAAVAEEAKKLAAGMMECVENDLEVAGGYVRLKSAPDVRKSLREVVVKAIGTPGFSMAGELAPGLEHTSYFTPEQSVYSNGTHVAEVEVDIGTGAVAILRYTLAHDCGRMQKDALAERPSPSPSVTPLPSGPSGGEAITTPPFRPFRRGGAKRRGGSCFGLTISPRVRYTH